MASLLGVKPTDGQKLLTSVAILLRRDTVRNGAGTAKRRRSLAMANYDDVGTEIALHCRAQRRG